MKKWLLLSLTAVILVVLASCTLGVQSTPTEKPPSTAKVGEAFKLGDWQITVTGLEFAAQIPVGSSGAEFYMADKTNTFAIVSVTVKNIGKTEKQFLPVPPYEDKFMVLYCADIGMYSRAMCDDVDLSSTTVNPGEEIDGIEVFEVSKKAETADKPIILDITEGSATVKLTLR